jgi:16S rRNA G527 N7-methylase RsmG
MIKNNHELQNLKEDTWKEWSLKYLETLKSEFDGLNLTNLLEVSDFYWLQVVDSVWPFYISSVLRDLVNIENLPNVEECLELSQSSQQNSLSENHLLTKKYGLEDLGSLTFLDEFKQHPFKKISVSGSIEPNKQARFCILDVGFGGGFPLLPLQKLLPVGTDVRGMELRAKKIKAVLRVAEVLNCSVKPILYHENLSEVMIDKAPVLIVCKAVASITDFLSWIRISPNLTDGVWVLFYKGSQTKKRENVPQNAYGFSLADSKEYELPGKRTGREYYLYSFRKENDVLRGTQKVSFKKGLSNIEAFLTMK